MNETDRQAENPCWGACAVLNEREMPDAENVATRCAGPLVLENVLGGKTYITSICQSEVLPSEGEIPSITQVTIGAQKTPE